MSQERDGKKCPKGAKENKPMANYYLILCEVTNNRTGNKETYLHIKGGRVREAGDSTDSEDGYNYRQTAETIAEKMAKESARTEAGGIYQYKYFIVDNNAYFNDYYKPQELARLGGELAELNEQMEKINQKAEIVGNYLAALRWAIYQAEKRQKEADEMQNLEGQKYREDWAREYRAISRKLGDLYELEKMQENALHEISEKAQKIEDRENYINRRIADLNK